MAYTKLYPTSKSLTIIGRLVGSCMSQGGPLAAKLGTLFLEEKYLELINFKFDYSESFSKDDYYYARQIQGFLSKQDFLDLGLDREKAAWETFLHAEELCKDTNERFRNGLVGVSPDVHAVLFSAARKISTILGDVPTYSELDFSFGPGATTSVKRARSNPRVKLEAPLTCSTSLLPHAKEFLAEFPGWTDSHIREGNLKMNLSHGKLQFVPKTSKTLRSIGVEPTLNGFGQQGIGRFLKKRLKRSGVDLSDQTKNQRLAREGSLTDCLATVDLSSASDTISYNLVMHLLPWDWFDLLDRFRTPCVSYKDKMVTLEKFSSMGNSYTFELESLIFYSLAFSVCTHLGLDPKQVSTYGDDIILPSAAMTLFAEILKVCGFIVNDSKSYSTGPFRESCGADYFEGCDIRPFYLKDQISVRTLFNMHNWFVRHGEPQLAGLVMIEIPTSDRIFGPDGYGDGHLIGSYRLRSSRSLKRAGFEGGFFDTYLSVNKRIKMRELTDWVYPTYSIYTLGDAESSGPRDHDVVPGSQFFKKVSIYTLKRSIFCY